MLRPEYMCFAFAIGAFLLGLSLMASHEVRSRVISFSEQCISNETPPN